MKSITGKILGLVLLTALFFGTSLNALAQTKRNSRPVINSPYALLQNPAVTNSPGAVATIKQVLATPPAPLSVPVIAAPRRAESGTYWTLQSPVPLPGDIFPGLPVYLLDATNRTFLIDDRSVDYAALQAQQEAENATNGSGVILQANDLIIDTNRLWLSVATNALPGSNLFNIVIHETVTGSYYDVLTISDLLLPTWAVENTVVGAVGNETPVTLAQNDRTNLFVWARESIIPIFTQPLAQEVFSGDSVTFSVAAAGSGLSYQWTLNGTNIYGATGSSYTIPNVNADNGGDYACIVQNADGSVTTQAATLTVDQGSGWPYEMSTVGQRQNYTFRSGITYLITSPIQLFGKTTIEGGAIIKFDYNFADPCLLVMGTLDCQSGAYNPAVLTSVDDDTFGLAELDSTGSPQPVFTGVPFLDLTYAGSVSLSNLRFRYADMAVGAPYFARVDVWDCQFVKCYAGVVNEFGGTDGFHNVLFSGCVDAVAGNTNAYAVEMEQVTADVSSVWDSVVSPSRLALTNSIILGSIGSVSTYSAQNVTVAPDAAQFQTNGTGNYYLDVESSLRQSGTTNISARLLAEFQNKTTVAPQALPQQMVVANIDSLTLSQQVARYSNGAPDLGYYYDALDYTVAWMMVEGDLIVEPGTVIGVRNEPLSGQSRYTWYGLDLRDNSSFTSYALAERPNIIADTQVVQEQDEYASSSLLVPDFQGSPADTAPVINCRFNKWYAPAGAFLVWGGDWEFVAYNDNLASQDSLVNWTMRDCELHGGRISLGLPDINNLDLTQYYGSGEVDWENNLFESVNISLNPATWWWNGVVNFDEGFTARNNLFKGANWMAIEPVPASAGDWTFTDNLFDGIDFQADPAMPLDFDYNGYRPLPASQTLSKTMPDRLSLTANDTTELISATNDLGGLHEVFLDYALPYAGGAFGHYYLTTVTPLWQAGSRTAGDAGLSQYTTFTSQAKDSASQPVNIGLHYVAATNSLPLDSDGDGVPDYLEDANGNYVADGDESNWHVPETNDVNFIGLTNGAVVSGAINIPVEIYGVTTNHIDGVTVYIDGNPLIGASGQNNHSPWLNWSLRWDTQMVTNGTYTICPEADSITDDIFQGSPVTVTVNNPISFPNYFTRCFGNQMWIYAQTTISGADYEIDVYGETNEFIGSFTGSADANGTISFIWDLTDGDGNTFSDNNFSGVFTVSSPSSSSGGSVHANAATPSSATNIWNRETAWALTDKYVIAYGPFDSGYASSKQLLAMLGGGEGVWGGVIHTLCDYGLGDQLSPGNVDQSSAFALDGAAARTNLLNDLADCQFRNFYFLGHGSASAIGGYAPASRITFYDIQKKLGNYLTSAKPLTDHPYRFVFIDGCSAGSGNLCEAFGIPAMTVSTNFFTSAGIWSRCFVGFKSWKNFNPEQWTWYSLMIGGFFDDWEQNQFTIQECVDRARTGVHNSHQVLMDSSVVIYGATNMFHNSY